VHEFDPPTDIAATESGSLSERMKSWPFVELESALRACQDKKTGSAVIRARWITRVRL